MDHFDQTTTTMHLKFQCHQSFWTQYCAIITVNPALLMEKVHETLDGRLILAKFTLLDNSIQPFYVLNLYAPAEHSSRSKTMFFSNMISMIHSLPNSAAILPSLIVALDFNYSFDSSSSHYTVEHPCTPLIDFVQHNLHDCFNVPGESFYDFTFTRGTSRSTIDYVLKHLSTLKVFEFFFFDPADQLLHFRSTAECSFPGILRKLRNDKSSTGESSAGGSSAGKSKNDETEVDDDKPTGPEAGGAGADDAGAGEATGGAMVDPTIELRSLSRSLKAIIHPRFDYGVFLGVITDFQANCHSCIRGLSKAVGMLVDLVLAGQHATQKKMSFFDIKAVDLFDCGLSKSVKPIAIIDDISASVQELFVSSGFSHSF
ncbi:uncharacterized protein ATC70_007885 [Mucor velutinosus]|uniref:Uncharacterized protein n=1 Tax=Mucor velutinosus TaxID=708070 RepID=A0AAN7D3W1_9FUNG|nr:hypothetical protein ATC70_007885 [Mucor velutinosus]